MIKAEEQLQCELHCQTAVMMPIGAHKGDLPSDVFPLDMSGTTWIYLGNISTYDLDTVYPTELKLVGSHVKREKYMNCNHTRILKEG